MLQLIIELLLDSFRDLLDHHHLRADLLSQVTHALLVGVHNFLVHFIVLLRHHLQRATKCLDGGVVVVQLCPQLNSSVRLVLGRLLRPSLEGLGEPSLSLQPDLIKTGRNRNRLVKTAVSVRCLAELSRRLQVVLQVGDAALLQLPQLADGSALLFYHRGVLSLRLLQVGQEEGD